MVDRTYPPGQLRCERVTAITAWLSFIVLYVVLLVAWFQSIPVPQTTPGAAAERLNNSKF